MHRHGIVVAFLSVRLSVLPSVRLPNRCSVTKRNNLYAKILIHIKGSFI